MFKRKDLITDVSSCNDPISSHLSLEEIKGLRPIGETFTKKYGTYFQKNEGWGSYQEMESIKYVTYRVKSHKKDIWAWGGESQPYEEVEVIKEWFDLC